MPMIGQPAPQFTAPAVVDGGDFKDIKLSDYQGSWTVLFFYPLDFTFVCMGNDKPRQYKEKINENVAIRYKRCFVSVKKGGVE